jgi:hypothetical protein
MSTIPITYQINKETIIDTINTQSQIEGIEKITIKKDYTVNYSNDISKINIKFKSGTELSLDILKSCGKTPKTLEDFRINSLYYLISFSKLILKQLSIDWKTFKNFITCKVPFENSNIDININVIENYVPDKDFEFASEKFININNVEPNTNWNENKILNTLDLEFNGKIPVILE